MKKQNNLDNLVKKFDISKINLSTMEKKLLDKLVKAAELIAPIYGLQINDKYPGANFYPYNATKEEVLEAAKDNPSILNPYTIVKRKKDGSLETTPYHIEYASLLKPVVKLIREAAGLTDNKDFAKRLEVQADALEHGSYEAADIYWLSMKPYKIDIVIGPVERYEDELFFKKTCYSAQVGIMDSQATKDAEKIRDAVLSSERKAFTLSQKVNPNGNLQVRVDNVPILSGLYARTMFAGCYLPNDPYLIEKYGSQMMIYSSVVRDNFEKSHFPIFKKVFQESFQKGYDRDFLLAASQKHLLIKNISDALVTYKNAEERLGQYYPLIQDMAAFVLAVKNAGSLLLKDVISQKELEAIIIMFICRAFDSILAARKIKSISHYGQGYAIALNYFIETGALRYNKVIWINFTRMFVALADLALSLDKILAFGDTEDAKHLIDEYGKLDNISKLIKGVKYARI